MDWINSTTFTPDRERRQHLKFEDRCSIRIYNKLGYSLQKTAEALDYAILKYCGLVSATAALTVLKNPQPQPFHDSF